MDEDRKLLVAMASLGIAIILIFALVTKAIGAPYEFVLHFPDGDGATSCLTRALQLGETQTDSVETTSFPDDTSITLDTRYLYNLKFLWIFPGPETTFADMTVPSIDTLTVDSLHWQLDYPSSGGYDSVFTRWRANGVGSLGSFWNKVFPFRDTIHLNADNFHKVEFDWYEDTNVVHADLIIPPQLASERGGYEFPSSPGLVNLFLQYSRNGVVQKNAVFWAENLAIATDTSTDQVIGPFADWDKTDSLGVALIQVVPSPYYHDSLKSLYDLSLYFAGKKIKAWPQYYVPNEDTVRITVED